MSSRDLDPRISRRRPALALEEGALALQTLELLLQPAVLPLGDGERDDGDASSCTSSWKAVETRERAVLSLYVRRELRALSAADRRAFFAAAEVVFRVPQATGRAAPYSFGAKYVDVGVLAMEHNYLAGNTVCDQMHDGLGFITNHGAETMQFEQSLQVSTPG